MPPFSRDKSTPPEKLTGSVTNVGTDSTRDLLWNGDCLQNPMLFNRDVVSETGDVPMDFAQDVKHRRSVRDYTDQNVSHELVNELLDLAVHAPSAMNEQPWAFAVIQDPLLLKTYSARAKSLVLNSPQVETKRAELQAMLAAPEFNVFYNSTTLIVIYAKPIGLHPDWDCCLAGENLMLAAADRGLATCPIGLAWMLFDQSDVKRELNVPDNYVTVLPIILGYPAQIPEATSRKKPEILCWKSRDT